MKSRLVYHTSWSLGTSFLETDRFCSLQLFQCFKLSLKSPARALSSVSRVFWLDLSPSLSLLNVTLQHSLGICYSPIIWAAGKLDNRELQGCSFGESLSIQDGALENTAVCASCAPVRIASCNNKPVTHCFTEIDLSKTFPLVCHWCPSWGKGTFVHIFPSQSTY